MNRSDPSENRSGIVAFRFAILIAVSHVALTENFPAATCEACSR
jgi:hypothetical protein